ncbi:MAG: hypothetical protein ABSC06_14015 [Rhodopila sp.]|jgi:hypothetical protein
MGSDATDGRVVEFCRSALHRLSALWLLLVVAYHIYVIGGMFWAGGLLIETIALFSMFLFLRFWLIEAALWVPALVLFVWTPDRAVGPNRTSKAD